jgi:protein SCO1/2
MSDPDASVPGPDPFRPPTPLDEPAGVGANPGSGSWAVTASPRDEAGDSRALKVVGGVLLGAIALVAAALLAIAIAVPKPPSPAAGRAATAPAILSPTDPAVHPAPEIELTDQDGQPFRLSSLRGRPVLVFFGYTHCPDVCPATVGTLNEVLAKVGSAPRVVFVSIDPERDDPAALKTYLQFLPKAYTGLTGTPVQIRETADAWGVRYARQDTTTGSYSMAHTADVYLVDAQGRLREAFPFGTDAAPFVTALDTLLAETPAPSDSPVAAAPASPTPAGAGASSTPTASIPSGPGASGTPDGGLQGLVISSEVWAGGPDPVILTISDAMGMQLDGTTPVDVTVTGAGNAAAGPPVRAVAVQPWGESTVYYVASVTIPSPGGWQLALSTPSGATGTVAVTALDQGSTTPLGAQAPNIHTPTLADVGGEARAVTTQPAPDLRLSQLSTSDARAAGKPYVIVIDSARFRVSQLCGKAIVMIRYLVDRWQDSVDFIHLEPFVYTIVTEEPVLSGDISNPPLNQWASAYGIGPAPWTAMSVPWVFVVDGQGVVRAKYEGIIGSADVDVMISLIENNGVIAGS